MSLEKKIQSIIGCDFKKDQDLTSYTTFRLASRGDVVEVSSVDACQALIKLLNELNKKYILVGWGANQILPAVCEDLVIHLSLPFDQSYLDNVHDHYVFPASLGLNYLTAHAIKFGLKGWDVFTGIPASLGGAVFMNAGTNLGEIGSLIEKVKVIETSGSIREEIITSKSFTYRHNHFVKAGEVIIEVTMKHLGIDEQVSMKIKEYMDYRKKTQPLATKNCGCVFKNPHKELQAGRLIDLLGLKELQVGGLRVSPKHGNFMENIGGANWDQFKDIIDVIKFEMDQFYGIEFELEVKIPYH